MSVWVCMPVCFSMSYSVLSDSVYVSLYVCLCGSLYDCLMWLYVSLITMVFLSAGLGQSVRLSAYVPAYLSACQSVILTSGIAETSL